MSVKDERYPNVRNFSNVASDNPSISIAFLPTKCTNFLRIWLLQAGLSQWTVSMIRLSLPFLLWIRVCEPQHGHTGGTVSTYLPRSRFSSTWGMIIFLFETAILHPMANSNSLIKVRLWREALETSHPSISIVSKIATGASSPKRVVVHWISRKMVSYCSSSNLKASPSL
mgnify:CR=1 FL=1